MAVLLTTNLNHTYAYGGGENLHDYQLASMLSPFTQKNVNVNVVLGQCFSGGFIDDLTKAGCVVATASTGSEYSWACGDIPYDEFVYQWTTAINGANHRGAKVYPDTDTTGRITMDEAFIYAKNHDRRSAEHPQYVSTPLSVGEDLAFNYLAPAVDIYIKDNPEDTGKEPNMTTDEFWKSPSIWVRNQDDGIEIHENPVYSPNHLASKDNSYPNMTDSIVNMIPLKKGIVSRKPLKAFNNQNYREVTVTVPGTLSDIIGSNINDIDSIVIKGTINDRDFNALWSATFNGNLSVINLEGAAVENDIIPSRAFWHQDEQLQDDGTIYVISLRKIILPNQIKTIGDFAFSYAIHLESINIPSKLQNLGIYCFSDCMSLATNPMQLPEGLMDIPAMCFMNCESLDEIKLPTTIKHIGEGAFYRSKIKRINFPDGLLSIGNAAFYSSDLEEVLLPASCLDFSGTHQFALNHRLKKINLPYGVNAIPNCFVYNDINLLEFDIPSTIDILGADALSACMALSEISLSEGLKEIESNAFWYCSALKNLVFPSSLTYLGGASCQYLQSLEAIYCSALTPPICDEDPSNKGRNHTFGPISGQPGHLCTPNNIPVYVPVGTSHLYASAYGWNYFTNFIETDDFPSSGTDSVIIDGKEDNGNYYDLLGRKVENPTSGNIYICNGKKILIK